MSGSLPFQASSTRDMLVVMSSNLLTGSVMRSALHVAEMVKAKTDTVAGTREAVTEREKDRGTLVFTETRADLHDKHGPGSAEDTVP